MRINLSSMHEFIRRTLLCHNPVGEHDHFVGAAYGTHAVCDNEHRLVFYQRDKAVCISVSFSTSRLAVASSSKIIGAFFRKARAIEIRCLSPPDNSQPFSPIML